jgi:hypothetical protein
MAEVLALHQALGLLFGLSTAFLFGVIDKVFPSLHEGEHHGA